MTYCFLVLAIQLLGLAPSTISPPKGEMSNNKYSHTLKINIPIGSITLIPTKEDVVRVRVSGLDDDVITLTKHGKNVEIVLNMDKVIYPMQGKGSKLESIRLASKFQGFGSGEMVVIKNGQFVRSQKLVDETHHNEVGISKDIHLNVFIPHAYNVVAKTGDGNIIAGASIRGSVSLTTSEGGITLCDVLGDAVVEATGGEVVVGKVSGDFRATVSKGSLEVIGGIEGKAEVEVGGNVKMDVVKGILDAKCSSGKIAVGEIGDKANIQATIGDIEVGTANGAISAVSQMGNIVLSYAEAEATLYAKAGNIRVLNSKKCIDVKTDVGDVSVGGMLFEKHKIFVYSKNGNINLLLRPNAKANVSFCVKNKGSFYFNNMNAFKDPKSNKQGTFTLKGGSDNILVNLKTDDGNIYLNTEK